jgi:hypothetical protein
VSLFGQQTPPAPEPEQHVQPTKEASLADEMAMARGATAPEL